MWKSDAPQKEEERKYYFWRAAPYKRPIVLRVDSFGFWWGAELVDHKWNWDGGEWWSEPIQEPGNPKEAK